MSDLLTGSELGEGTRIGGYRVLRTAPVEHVDGTFVELVHERTGARHLHVACPDDNNAFTVAFRTVPTDSSGVAHILEHVVLAGSQRYPVRDPFFSMINRSLSTFMNAFTAADVTAYPFSTRNRKDFFNLLSLYLDATFFPRLAEGSFQQEGHRLEFAETEDATSGLRHKGVVFNEMKGARSTPQSVVDEAIGEALFPDLTYAFDSGGDPEHIVDLTWEQLKRFHAENYHPSRAHFFTAGDIPLEETLAVIERDVLDRFEPVTGQAVIGDQPAFGSPVVFNTRLPVAEQSLATPQGQAAVAWATVPSADTYEVLKMSLLSEVLIGNAGAPLRRALVESGIGDALADRSGFHNNFQQAVFSIGLKGIKPEDAEKVQALVLTTLEQLATDGIEAALVEGALHRLEIEQREVSNAGFPYSLRLALGMSGPEMYGGDPYRALRFDDDLARLNRERAAGPLLEETIRRQLLDNPHRALVVVTPDSKLEQQKEQAELARLAQTEARLSEVERTEIVRVTTRLRDEQESGVHENRESLPDLELSDIPTKLPEPSTEVRDVGGVPVHFYPQATNGFIYFDVEADFSRLPGESKDLLGLFAYALTRSGAAGEDYVALSRRLVAYTGGITAGANARLRADGAGFTQSFRVLGKALARNSVEYTRVLRDIVTAVSFDKARLADILQEFRALMEGSVAFGGTDYATSLASAALSARGAINERMSGLTEIRLLRELSARGDAAIEPLIAGLERVRDTLFSRDGVRLAITAEESMHADMEKLAAELVAALPERPATNGHVEDAPYPRAHRARTWSVPVAYNVVVRQTVPFTHPDAAPLRVLAHLLRETFIHPEIREKGGAYGGRVVAASDTGLFNFGSYRDPNITRTFSVFEQATRYAVDERFTAQAIKGAILSASRETDPLESPDTRGRRRFADDYNGFTVDEREKFRAGLLATSEDDLHRVAATYLQGREGVMAIVGDQAKIEAANKEMGGVFEVEPL